MALVAKGHLDHFQALADLAADALVASCAEDISEELRGDLLGMAQAWALKRAQGLSAQVIIATSPVPDDLSGLEDTGEGAQ